MIVYVLHVVNSEDDRSSVAGVSLTTGVLCDGIVHAHTCDSCSLPSHSLLQGLKFAIITTSTIDY